jgi:regulator of replication initiation timing
MNKWDDAYDEKMDKSIRIIKDYDLVELSLVDNPANQFANILSVEKVDGVDMIKGDNLDVEFENVFWDSESGIVKVSELDAEVSPLNGSPMRNIGFVEKNDNEKTEMIKFLVDSAKGINLSKMTKEASPMNKTTEEVVKNDKMVEETKVAPEADATVEDAAKKSYSEKDKSMEEKSMHEDEDMDEKSMHEDEMKEEETKSADMDADDEESKGYKKSEDEVKSEAVDEEDEVSKSDGVIVNAVADIKNTLTSAFSDLADTVKSLHEQVAELNKSLGVVKSELTSVKSEVTQAQTEFNNFGKRVDAVEADTAFRKSGDLGEIVQEQPEKVEKSLWGGRFLKTADLFN